MIQGFMGTINIIAIFLYIIVSLFGANNIYNDEFIDIANFEEGYTDNLNNTSEIDELAFTLNKKGNILMDLEKYGEAKDCYLQALKLNPNERMKDIIYNNLSWVHFSCNEFEDALKYSELSLSMSINTDVEYTNYANVLYALGNISKAYEMYKNALNINDKNAYAFYGKGQIDYYYNNYDEAIDMFNSYLKIQENDTDALCYLGLCYLYGKNNITKAWEYLDKAYNENPNDYFVLDNLVNYYYYIEETDKIEKLYLDWISKNPDDYDVICDLAIYYYSNYNNIALEYLDKAIKINPFSYRAYIIKSNIYYNDNEEEKANEEIELLLKNNGDDFEAFYEAANYYYNRDNYIRAIELYEKSIELNPICEDAYIGKLYSLFYSKYFTDCIEFGEEIQELSGDYTIPWFIGAAYSNICNTELALYYYEKALEIEPNSIGLLLDIGWEYYALEKYSEADEFANRILEIESYNESAKELKEYIKEKNLSVTKQVTNFIENNYMYFKENSDYESLKSKLLEKDEVKVESLAELFATVYKEDDPFSFFIYGEDYDYYSNSLLEDSVEYKKYNNNINYIKIKEFVPKTANDFLDKIKDIENTKDEYLIIDVRDNFGGTTESGCDILDYLLPECCVANIMDKNGYTAQYFSLYDQIVFKHIYILTNQNTASCSELVALGLKTYLDNTTIIGENTFGKGVGQVVFENKKMRFAIFAVNHYWNVRETNILDKGIEPDIRATGTLDNYINVINDLIQ